MIDHQRCGPLVQPRHTGQRRLPAGSGRHVDTAQRLRPRYQCRVHFQHHPVLVGLGKQGGNLPLGKGVLQYPGNVRYADTQPCRRVTVNLQIELLSAMLQVGGHVGQLGALGQRVHQPRHPLTEALAVETGQSELILGTGHPVLDAQLLHRLEPGLNAFHLGGPLAQPLDHAEHRLAAFAVGWQIDEHAPAVEAGIGTIHTDKGGQTDHPFVFQQGCAQCLLPLAHGGKGNILRCLGHHLNHATVLHRKKVLGHRQIQQPGQRNGRQHHQQHQRLTIQHPLEHLAVTANGAAHQAAALGLFVMGQRLTQHARAHHRRQRQRHHQRNGDRHRQSHGKLVEQPANQVAHEQQRDQHGNQRQGQRDQGKTDLCRALERSLHR